MPRARFILLPVAIIAGLAFLRLGGTTEKNHVGEALPALNVEFPRGAPDLKGHPLIVEFWATWCPPCRKSIPHLNEVYDKYRARGLEIVGITAEDEAMIGSFVKDNPIKYHPAVDRGGKLAKQFGIRGIPHAMLVDKAGKIVWEGHPMALEEKDMEALLK
jgi:thiol-disulfide isomerase/thioredoxin